MPLYRYILRPSGPFGTPLRSDTLHGHLVCVAAELDGPDAATALVERFISDDPPFVCSSAFPAGLLPMPCLPPIPRRVFRERYADPDGSFAGDLFLALSVYKKFRKRRFLPVAIWEELADRMSPDSLFERWMRECRGSMTDVAGNDRNGQCARRLLECTAFDPPKDSRHRKWSADHLQTHNTIDRASGAVLQDGGFHLTESTFYRADAALHLYVRTDDMAAFERLLEHIAACGFGRDRSTGNGQFTWQRDEAFDPAPLEAPVGSHRMTLSVLSAMDLSAMRGWYGVFSKHGKVWDGLGGTNPFKKPFLAVAEGGVFESLPRGGFVLRGLHPDPQVAQILWPLTIPLAVSTTEA